MLFRIPPHVAWPLFVIALLSLSVVTVTITVVAARSDGGAQVVEDYYQKAVTWDEKQALQAASDTLGWQVSLTVEPAPALGQPRPVTLLVIDRTGAPVDDLQGTLTAYRPQFARPVAEHPLAAVEGTPGVYRHALPITRPGLWDFDIVATRDTLRFHTRIRREVR